MKIILFLILFYTSIHAADYYLPTAIGSSAYSKGIGAQGFEKTSVGVLDNPGSLSHIDQYSFSFFSSTIMNDFLYQTLSYAKRISAKNVLGMAYVDLGVSAIPKTSLGSHSGFNENIVLQDSTYSYSNSLYKVSWQHNTSKTVSIGTSLTYYKTRLASLSGTGVNMDLGLHYKSLSGLTEISVQSSNIIPALNVTYSNGTTETLPFYSTVGIKRRLDHLTLFIQLKSTSLSTSSYLHSLGGEYKIPFVPLSFFGTWYQLEALESIKDSTVLGIRLNMWCFKANYSYEKSEYPKNDNTYYFSLSVDI